jgi:hypothetical protein
MRMHRPFIPLPLRFDPERLAAEIGQFGEDDWRPHPQRFEGNSSLVLVSTGGEENDDFRGPMAPSPRLRKTPYIRQVMAAFDTVIGRSRLMRLAPGASVSEHSDTHYFWRTHLRIHIPIITDARVDFHCEEEVVQMAAGESWTFDNWRPHSVHNRSDRERIHLVIDTVGSAAFWRLAQAGQEVRNVPYAEDADPQLRFENFRGLPVMHPSELRGDLEWLVRDIAENTPAEADLKSRLIERSADLVYEWQSLWTEHGPTVDGFPEFKRLRDAFQQEVDRLPEDLLQASNRYPAKTAITYTLDATLTPDNLQVAEEAPAASAGPQRPRFDRPVFIVAAPRSGSTLLFETLAVNRELWSLGGEAHAHFERIASLRPSGQNPSNRLTADAATPEVVDMLMGFLVEDLVNSSGTPYREMAPLTRPTELRFLEKTPKNALRIPFLLKVFPDARFIFLYRDPRQNISSLMDSWRSGRYVTYPQLPGWPAGQPWSHLLIPGWEQLRGRPLAEIAARQWQVTNQTILDDLEQLPGERWCAIDYDSLLANTRGDLQRLCAFAQIIFGPRMHEVASRPLKLSKFTLTPPHPDKWKKNAAELEAVLPATEPLLARLRALPR